MQNKEWFEEWFDSEYYHILYQHRDDDDAQLFIDNIVPLINLKPHQKVADIACGKGRHAIILNKKMLDVVGSDLSENSIKHAQQLANNTLNFVVNDMRNPLPLKFDAIFNLFTSFGYFNCHDENLKVLNSFHSMLNDEGYFIIDFFNADKVKNELTASEKIVLDGIEFMISRKIENDCIVKEIKFEHKKLNHLFTEKVQLLTLSNFIELCGKAALEINYTFGDYALNEFDIYKSERLILIGRKLNNTLQ
jgi:SAM-dependent methyltransferase